MTLQKSDIRTQIYNDLREQIFTKKLNRERLVETQIAEQYHVNKRHVREVLIKLQEQKLVLYIPMKGFQVLGISRTDLLEIAKREMLESAIFEDFLERATDSDLNS